jgi:hypothetical protein
MAGNTRNEEKRNKKETNRMRDNMQTRIFPPQIHTSISHNHKELQGKSLLLKLLQNSVKYTIFLNIILHKKFAKGCVHKKLDFNKETDFTISGLKGI